MSGIVNKVKDILHKDKDTTHTDSTHSTTQGAGHTGTTGHGTINPADRNNDGKVDTRDVTGQHGATGGLATTGVLSGHNTTGHGTTGGLSGHNTTGHGTTGGLTGHGTANPVDRNNDGRVDARDLTGQHSSGGGLTGHSTSGHGTASHGTSSGLTGALGAPLSQHPLDSHGSHNTRTGDILDPHVSSTGTHGHSGTTGGLGHNTTTGGLGHSSGGGLGHTANPIDRNNDGRVDARDLSTQASQSHGQHGNLEHRSGETGELPRALVEPVSKAQPHGAYSEEGHSATHGTSSHNQTSHAASNQGKPSMADKLNPKTDSDRDGKAGIMD